MANTTPPVPASIVDIERAEDEQDELRWAAWARWERFVAFAGALPSGVDAAEACPSEEGDS